MEVNELLATRLKLPSNSLYAYGWVVWLLVEQGRPPPATLKDLASALPLIRAKIAETSAKCFVAVPDYDVVDVGVECAATVSHLNDIIVKASIGDLVHVVTDDRSADLEMRRWEYDGSQSVIRTRAEGDLFHFIVKKTKA